jgi:hypothetical protein
MPITRPDRVINRTVTPLEKDKRVQLLTDEDGLIVGLEVTRVIEEYGPGRHLERVVTGTDAAYPDFKPKLRFDAADLDKLFPGLTGNLQSALDTLIQNRRSGSGPGSEDFGAEKRRKAQAQRDRDAAAAEAKTINQRGSTRAGPI